MSLTRRGIMTMLGMGVAAPGLGVKASAKAMGLDDALNTSVPLPLNTYAEAEERVDRWYNSRAYIAQEATRDARQKYERHRYEHMKSWGAGFRHSVIRRDLIVERMFEQRVAKDKEFLERVIGIFEG